MFGEKSSEEHEKRILANAHLREDENGSCISSRSHLDHTRRAQDVKQYSYAIHTGRYELEKSLLGS